MVIDRYPCTYDIRINSGTGLLFSLIFAVLMSISANSFIYLPFTPVPITTQVFTVLISSLILGSRLAFTSQLIYITAGLIGLPVFSGFKNGFTALAGPTGGYIIGFLAAAFVSGYIYESLLENKKSYAYKLFISFISLITGAIIIHFFGFIYLAGYFYSISGNSLAACTLIKAWESGTKPFLLIDLIKIIVAALIVNIKKNKK
jgi:biotin transport system substrate-specific component